MGFLRNFALTKFKFFYTRRYTANKTQKTGEEKPLVCGVSSPIGLMAVTEI
jgi:hypothetical protein